LFVKKSKLKQSQEKRLRCAQCGGDLDPCVPTAWPQDYVISHRKSTKLYYDNMNIELYFSGLFWYFCSLRNINQLVLATMAPRIKVKCPNCVHFIIMVLAPMGVTTSLRWLVGGTFVWSVMNQGILTNNALVSNLLSVNVYFILMKFANWTRLQKIMMNLLTLIITLFNQGASLVLIITRFSWQI
jgi:hypothetical protein